jgi:hypothetical protein
MSWNHIGLLFFPSVTLQRSMADGKWKIFFFFWFFCMACVNMILLTPILKIHDKKIYDAYEVNVFLFFFFIVRYFNRFWLKHTCLHALPLLNFLCVFETFFG